MKLALNKLAATTIFLVFGAFAGATEDDTAAATQSSSASQAETKRELTPEERAEKEACKACKAKIRDIIATRDPEGDDVSCDIAKTWREEDIVKMLGGKIGWPWGKAVCQSKLELERKALALAMSKEAHEIVMPVQKERCMLAQKDGGEP